MQLGRLERFFLFFQEVARSITIGTPPREVQWTALADLSEVLAVYVLNCVSKGGRESAGPLCCVCVCTTIVD